MLDNEIPEPTQNSQQSMTHDRVIQPSAAFVQEIESKQPSTQPVVTQVDGDADPATDLLSSDGLVPEYSLVDLNQVEDIDVEVETPDHL